MSFFSGRRFFYFFPFLLALCARLYAQESILFSYERNFIRASLPDKIRVLTDASGDENAAEFTGALYEFALRFALANREYLYDDPDMIALVGTAARGAGAGGSAASVKTLWELFGAYDNPHSRVEILGALAILGKGDTALIRNLNRFLDGENKAFKDSDGDFGAEGQEAVLNACIAALGVLGDTSSFPVLFSAMVTPYPQALIQETLKAIASLQGYYKDYLLEIIRNNPFPEKAAAFRLGAYNEKLKPEERGELAQTALEAALAAADNSPAGTRSNEQPLRYDAVTVLTRLKWTPAAPLVIRNFYKVQTDYTSGTAPKERLLDAIACLAVMGSSEAAQALTLQLGYFNSQKEKSEEYDEEIILALINALGELGDKAAFDYLLYIGYLNYPDKIQTAAQEALNRLKW